jgi:hypothetical protein
MISMVRDRVGCCHTNWSRRTTGKRKMPPSQSGKFSAALSVFLREFRGFARCTNNLRSVIVEAEGEQGMKSIQSSRLRARMSFAPSLERAAVSIWCPDCQNAQVRRSKTRGIVESLLALLLIRPYRCQECDCRFFRWSILHKPKATGPTRRSNA